MKSGFRLKILQLYDFTLSMRRAMSSHADSTWCRRGVARPAPPSLRDPQRFCQRLHSSNRDRSAAPKAQPRTLPKGATHHPILWWVLWSTLLSLSSPTCNWGAVTGKRTFQTHSKSESQENPTYFQCCVGLFFFVLRCHSEQLKKRYTADLDTFYINSSKMPFKAHVKNEAPSFLLQQFI